MAVVNRLSCLSYMLLLSCVCFDNGHGGASNNLIVVSGDNVWGASRSEHLSAMNLLTAINKSCFLYPDLQQPVWWNQFDGISLELLNDMILQVSVFYSSVLIDSISNSESNQYMDPMVITNAVSSQDRTSEINHLKALVNQLNSSLLTMKAEYDMKISSLQNHCFKTHIPTKQSVAFYASSTRRQSLRPLQAALFDLVETNIGNHYDPLTGIFTAPVRGLYFFAANIMAVPGKFAHLEIVKNGRRVSSIFAAKAAIPYNSDTGNAVVNLLLQKGDKVWIRDQNDSSGEGTINYTYAMFSGFIINQDV